ADGGRDAWHLVGRLKWPLSSLIRAPERNRRTGAEASSALLAEFVSLAIRFGQRIGKPHHAISPPAMAKPENVAEFMRRLGDRAPLKRFFICRFSIATRVKPGDGKDGSVSGARRLSKDEVQFRRE